MGGFYSVNVAPGLEVLAVNTLPYNRKQVLDKVDVAAEM